MVGWYLFESMLTRSDEVHLCEGLVGQWSWVAYHIQASPSLSDPCPQLLRIYKWFCFLLFFFFGLICFLLLVSCIFYMRFSVGYRLIKRMLKLIWIGYKLTTKRSCQIYWDLLKWFAFVSSSNWQKRRKKKPSIWRSEKVKWENVTSYALWSYKWCIIV